MRRAVRVAHPVPVDGAYTVPRRPGQVVPPVTAFPTIWTL